MDKKIMLETRKFVIQEIPYFALRLLFSTSRFYTRVRKIELEDSRKIYGLYGIERSLLFLILSVPIMAKRRVYKTITIARAKA